MFPKTTKLPAPRFIPKDKFYSRADLSPRLKSAMVSDIAKITVTHNFSARTMNITPGQVFPEITVLHVLLKKKKYDPKLLDVMDKSIRAAFVLFILEFDGKLSPSIAFKDKNGDNITITKRWTGDFGADMDLKLSGRTVDAVYTNLIKQISNGMVVVDAATDLKQGVQDTIIAEKQIREIARLELKIKNEKQFNRKLELRAELKKLKGAQNG